MSLKIEEYKEIRISKDGVTIYLNHDEAATVSKRLAEIVSGITMEEWKQKQSRDQNLSM